MPSLPPRSSDILRFRFPWERPSCVRFWKEGRCPKTGTTDEGVLRGVWALEGGVGGTGESHWDRCVSTRQVHSPSFLPTPGECPHFDRGLPRRVEVQCGGVGCVGGQVEVHPAWVGK